MQSLVRFEWQHIPLGALCLPGLRWILRIHHLNDDESTRYLRSLEWITLIERPCPQGYRIVKEGGARERGQVLQQGLGEEVVTQQRWGIQFECK